MKIYSGTIPLKPVFFSVIMLFCGGCSYHQPTTLIRPPQEGQEKTINDVSVRIKPLRDFECAHYFDNRLVSKGIQPIQIYIQNNSQQFYVLNGKNISVPLIGKRGVGAVLYKNSYTRALLWLIGLVAIRWEIFLPILVVDSIACTQANKNIKNDITSICINPREKLVIPPHTKIHKVLFVDQDEYHHHITLMLVEQETDDEITFTF